MWRPCASSDVFIMSVVSVLTWVVVCSSAFYNGCNGSSVDNPYSSLIQDLLDGYDKIAPPVNQSSDVVPVTFQVCLRHIEEISDKDQRITLSAFITQVWYDVYLRWNISEYGGITEIRLPADTIWRPDIALYNSADADLTNIMHDLNVVISHDGQVVWDSPTLLTTSCRFDITYIPFDQQECRMLFASWSYSNDQVILFNDSVHLDSYHENGEWGLVEAAMAPRVFAFHRGHRGMTGVEMTLVLERYNKFYQLFMMVPFMLIAGISLLVFLLPADSGEKLSLCITNLLTLVMFYGQVSSSIPVTADGNFPIIGTYYFSVICIVSASCVLTVLVLNIHYRKDSNRPVPRWARRLFFGRYGLHHLAWYVPGSRNSDKRNDHRISGRYSTWQPEIVGQSFLVGSSPLISGRDEKRSSGVNPYLRDLRRDVQRIEKRLVEDADVEITDWEKMAVIMDQIFFTILTLTSLMLCIVFGVLIRFH